jgi:putative ubiquitin-RnfH superfamily antitoxin RatB of RatAB toxin-antitoxin module
VISIEVVYALPDRAICIGMQCAAGTSVAAALSQVANEAAFASVDVMNLPVGIFGRAVRREELLKDGDRIELYRPLAQDPKVARRNRARARQ